MHRGYIKLWRKVQDSDFWFKNRRGKHRQPTELEAWLDLILSANHAPGYVNVSGHRVQIGRGQLVASLRYLAERWHWSKNKVNSFQIELKLRGDIGTDQVFGMNRITIVNYNTYNYSRDTEGTQTGTAKGQPRDSQGTNRRM